MGKGGIEWDGWSLGLGDHEAFPAVLITQFVQRDPRPLALITWPAKERTIVHGSAAHTGIDMVELQIRRMAKSAHKNRFARKKLDGLLGGMACCAVLWATPVRP